MGMNLAEHFDLFYNLQGLPDTNKFGINLVKILLNLGEGFVNKRSSNIYEKWTFNSTDDTERYSIATNLPTLLLYKIDSLLYSTTDSTEREELYATTEKQLDIDRPTWRSDGTNNPLEWFVDEDTKEIVLYPYEGTVSDGTNCIQARGRKIHTKMTHYYANGTVSIDQDGTAVVGAGGANWIDDINVSAGDMLGIGKLLDSSTEFPVNWYEIASVDSVTGITLAGDFTEAAASGASYIIASPSSIDNEQLNLASVSMAMAYSKQKNKDRRGYEQDKSDALDLIAEEMGDIEDSAADNEAIVDEYHDL